MTIVLWVGGSFLEPALDCQYAARASYGSHHGCFLPGHPRHHELGRCQGGKLGNIFHDWRRLALGAALTRTGATDWIAELISPLVTGPPLIVSLMLLVFHIGLADKCDEQHHYRRRIRAHPDQPCHNRSHPQPRVTGVGRNPGYHIWLFAAFRVRPDGAGGRQWHYRIAGYDALWSGSNGDQRAYLGIVVLPISVLNLI